MAVENGGPKELLVESSDAVILVRPEFREAIQSASFQPGFWRENAVPVASGGRGSAWFINSSAGRWVLRHYCRGGWPARVSRRTYWFSGQRSVRAVREFRLLTALYSAGLPVPKPVAARYRRRSGLFYQAEILVERIPGAVPFADCLDEPDVDLWRRAGELVRVFHDHNVYHADLNCHNILVAAGQLYLIDFDKGKLRPDSEPSSGWKKQNLERLERSLRKHMGEADDTGLRVLWPRLLAGYAGGAPAATVNPCELQQ